MKKQSYIFTLLTALKNIENHSKQTSIFRFFYLLVVLNIVYSFRQLSGFCHPIPQKHCSGNVALRSRFQIALHLEQDQTEHGNAPIIASLISDRCTWPITRQKKTLPPYWTGHSYYINTYKNKGFT